MRLTLTLFSLFACLTFGAVAQSWQPLGSGLNGKVRAIAVYNNKIYAGGAFTVGNNSYVAEYDETSQTWSTAGNGLTNEVFALTVHDGKLYAGGNFTQNGSGTTCFCIAVLNGNTWEPVLNGMTAVVRCIYSDGNDMYVGGSFSNNTPTPYIAKYSSAGWVNMGNPGGYVTSIAKFNGSIYISGGSQMGMFARLDAGNTWTKLGANDLFGNEASSLAVFGSYLYVAGLFNGSYGYGVVRYNTTSGLTLGFNPLNGYANVLYATPTRLVAGGAFTRITGGDTLNHFFSYNGNTPYTTIGSGFDGEIFSFGNQNGYILAGGTFTLANGVTVNNICRSTTTIDVQEIESVVLESTVYPNPMIQQATLSFKTREYLQAPSLQILDATGRCVKSFPEPTSNQGLSVDYIINRESLATGTYFYFLSEGESQLASGKLIVQ